MRIVIELDGLQEPVVRGPSAPSPGAPGAEAEEASDGGGGPNGVAGGSEAAEMAVVTDSGPPPEWLLEAVAAAEAAGHRTGPAAAADAGYGLGDAGAGPDS